jgi:hypothetical protein
LVWRWNSSAAEPFFRTIQKMSIFTTEKVDLGKIRFEIFLAQKWKKKLVPIHSPVFVCRTTRLDSLFLRRKKMLFFVSLLKAESESTAADASSNFLNRLCHNFCSARLTDSEGLQSEAESSTCEVNRAAQMKSRPLGAALTLLRFHKIASTLLRFHKIGFSIFGQSSEGHSLLQPWPPGVKFTRRGELGPQG